jgi:hypothetical protein
MASFGGVSILAGILTAGVTSLSAQELAGLAVGDQAPAFELKNQAGETVKLSTLLEKGPVALVFYRSADW